MMRWLIATSLRIRVAVVVLTLLLLFLGTQIIKNTAFDVFPEFAPPYVEIQTEAPGLSSAEVELLVSVPIESAMNGISWLKKVKSKSVLGLSSVVMYFSPSTDLMLARQMVAERLAEITSKLPDVAKTPVMLSPLSSCSRLMKIGINSKTMNQMEMTDLAKWTIRPKLMSITGVANVAIWGQRDRQIQVLIDPQQLATHGITADQVKQAVSQVAEIGGGGFMDTPNQRMAISYISTIKSPEDLYNVPVVLRNNVPIKLGDVARIVEGFPPPIGDAIINDEPGLLLIVEKQPWGNTLETTHKVDKALKALAPALKGLEVDAEIFRPATYIEMSLANLNKALLIGCVLVVLVLLFFLNNWRTALISVLAIPTSLITAALILNYQGGTINTMVLAGLIIALGVLVDDAIIDVENIMRRLRQNNDLGHPKTSFKVVLDAALEVRSPVVIGSVIASLVLLPVFFLEGLSGSFFKPLASTYIIAVLASLLVALIITPALSLLLLPKSAEHKETGFIVGLKDWYERLLPKVFQKPKLIVGSAAALLVAAIAVVPFLGEEFLPNFKEYDFLMHWCEKPGCSIEAMDRITVQASKELRAVPGVRNFGSHVGRAEVADEVVGPNFTELWISLDPKADYHKAVKKVNEIVDGYPGLYRDLLTYLRERIKEVLTGGSAASIVVRIYGENLEILRNKADDVKKALTDIKGIADLKIQQQVLVPQIEVKVKTEEATQYGLTAGRIRDLVNLYMKGAKVGEYFKEQSIYDVVVWGEKEVRSDLPAFRSMMIDLPSGGQVPLSEVAEITVVPTPNVITREYNSRYIEVTCNVKGRDLAGVAKDINAQVKTVSFDRGYHPEIIGEYAAQKEARNRMMLLSILSLLLIFVILQADLRKAKLAFLVIIGLIFALVGSVIAVLIGSKGILSLGSIIGFVTVLGIAGRNGIMLITHYQHLEHKEHIPFGPELVARGSRERLSPILMTTLACAFALLPIIFGGDKPGMEIEHPMAIVILGGLFSSMFLNLIVMPILYLRFGKTSEKEEAHARDVEGDDEEESIVHYSVMRDSSKVKA